MSTPLTILVAEDDDDDFFFTARILRKLECTNVVRVESGRAAIDYLSAQIAGLDKVASAFPDVMLLDLKMDEVDGHEVLTWIRENLSPRPLPVFVLTGSGEQRDRERVKTAGVAAGYFVKPLSEKHLMEILPAKTPSAL